MEGADPTLPIQAVDGTKTELANRLKVSVTRLNQIVASGGPFADVGNVAAEIEVMVRMRALTLAPAALDALERIMTGDFSEDMRGVASIVRAADSILDRTILPKRTRAAEEHQRQSPENELPNLSELLKSADSPADYERIVNAYRDTLDQIDRLRRGARDVIDITPTSVE